MKRREPKKSRGQMEFLQKTKALSPFAPVQRPTAPRITKPDSPHALEESTMTWKDLELIAAVIKGLLLEQSNKELVAVEFAEALKGINPRFNSDRFLRACK